MPAPKRHMSTVPYRPAVVAGAATDANYGAPNLDEKRSGHKGNKNVQLGQLAKQNEAGKPPPRSSDRVRQAHAGLLQK